MKLKFRAWDKEFKEIYDVDMIRFFSGIIEVDNESDHQTDKISKYEVMQFTGITDKNGKEIFEGDILKCFNGSQDKVGTVVQVFYDDTYTGYYPFNRDEVGFNTNSNSIEVIGNIYENEILIKESVENERY